MLFGECKLMFRQITELSVVDMLQRRVRRR